MNISLIINFYSISSCIIYITNFLLRDILDKEFCHQHLSLKYEIKMNIRLFTYFNSISSCIIYITNFLLGYILDKELLLYPNQLDIASTQ